MIIQLLNQGRSYLGKKWDLALGEEKGDRTWGRKGIAHLGKKRLKCYNIKNKRINEKL